MKKIIGIMLGASLFAVAGIASASVNVQSNIVPLVNGKTSGEVDAGNSFDFTFTVDATNGDEVEYVRTRVRDQNSAIIYNHCENVGRLTGDDVEVTVEGATPDDTPQGNIDVLVDVFGNPGVSQHDGCTGSSLDSETYDDVVRVGDNTSNGHSNGSGNVGGSSSVDKKISDAIGSLKEWIISKLGGTTTPAPATNAKCAALATKMLGTVQNANNSANVMLQGFLLSEGMQIPALAAGASFGFYGPQTASAVQNFKAANQCL